jgi:ketosteroid isomerase-like protein
VSLSGDAGDELFGGYNRYRWGPALVRRIGGLPRPLRSGLGGLLTAVPTGAYDRLGDAYSEDAVVLAPASTRLDGRAAIADYWRRVGAVDGKVSVAMRSADVDGSEILQTGVWGVEMTTASGEVVRQGGNLLRVMEEDGDGGRRIKLESWN